MASWWGRAALGAAAAYVLFLGWAMQNLSYDVWGAMVVGPILGIVSVAVLRRSFGGTLAPLLPIAYVGLVAKLAGSLLRYWVAFDAYGGAADAGRYHTFGRELAGEIRGGRESILQIIPTGTGTQFIDHLTATIYTVFGSSRLAGFLLFAFMGYMGAVLFVRAAALALPECDLRRYAALVFLLPSLVYWPSSVGKEAWMMLCLGLGSYGGARLLAGANAKSSVLVTALGLGGAAVVRPHLGGMWLAGIAVALLASLMFTRSRQRVRSRSATAGLMAIAMVGFTLVAAFALRYLEPGNEESGGAVSSRVTDIFNETSRRSEQGGSAFETIDLNGPLSWPFAIIRTMTRPMLNEAGSVAELLPAIEMTALLIAAAVGWRRFANIALLLKGSPYLVFAIAVVLMFGLAFTTIGNLGILSRQRSLALPLMAILWCLPPLPSPAERRAKALFAPQPGVLVDA